MHNLPLNPSSMTANFFSDLPVTVTAVPKFGSVFADWSDGNMNAPRAINPGEVATLTASFK